MSHIKSLTPPENVSMDSMTQGTNLTTQKLDVEKANFRMSLIQTNIASRVA